MRLWHKSLIPVLPKQQLLGQWRECCLIAKSITEKGTPNHLLVNKVLDYPMVHFYFYAELVADEMRYRGYKCDFEKFIKWAGKFYITISYDELFAYWHDVRYLKQCYYNLEEKYDCGGITEKEWQKIEQAVGYRI